MMWERLAWIIFQTARKEQDRVGGDDDEKTPKTNKQKPPKQNHNTLWFIHLELNLRWNSLPPQTKQYIFFNCDLLPILVLRKPKESKGNWLMDSIRNAVHS